MYRKGTDKSPFINLNEEKKVLTVEDAFTGVLLDFTKSTTEHPAFEIPLNTTATGDCTVNDITYHYINCKSGSTSVYKYLMLCKGDGGACFYNTTLFTKKISKIEVVGTTKKHGTYVRFKPDPTIFVETTTYDYDIIHDRLKQVAYLNRGITIVITDARKGAGNKSETFCYKGGIKEYVQYINHNKVPLFEEVIYCEGSEPIELASGNSSHVYAEVALQYNDGYSAAVYSFCNNVSTHEGGTHEEGFRLAMTRVVNAYARDNKFLKENEDNLTYDDIKEGLTAVISVISVYDDRDVIDTGLYEPGNKQTFSRKECVRIA